MNERPTSFSFPRGAQCDRTEAQARADLNMAQVIHLAAKRPQHRNCPYCATDPLPAAKVNGRFVVECEECCEIGREVRCYSDTLEGAWKLWDARP